MGNWRYNALVAIHELVEVVLLQGVYGRYGSSGFGYILGLVDDFDIQYEKARPAGDVSEPGDSVDAPYRDEHCIATAVEHMLCGAMRIPWSRYNDGVENL